MNGIVTSNRLDSILACVFKLSRSQALDLLRAEKAFVNGKMVQNPSYTIKPNEIISLRGYGRFVFVKESGMESFYCLNDIKKYHFCWHIRILE